MKFSIQRALIIVAAICLVVAAIVRGEHLLGGIGIVLFAALIIPAIALLINLLHKWKAHSLASKIVVFTFVGFVAYTLIFPKSMWPDYDYFARTRQWQRAADKLQTTLSLEPEYEHVRVCYNAPPSSKSECLDISGDVPNWTAYSELVDRVESMDGWFVIWNVTINKNVPPAETAD